jgi:hypothetical protein
VAGEAEGADGEVPAGGERAGSVACAGLGAVLVVGDVADVVDAVLDGPVAADEPVELCGVGLVGGEAGEEVGRLGRDQPVMQVAAFAVDADDLRGVVEQTVGCGRGRRGAVVDATVASAGGFVFRGKRTLRGGPGRWLGRSVGCL